MRYFFSTELIKSAIEDIESRKSHELVILYLATIVEKKDHPDERAYDANEMYETIKPWLRVKGNSYSQYFRPFVSRGSSYWMNNNLAGSYAQSSLRGQKRDLFYNDLGKLIKPDARDVSKAILKGKKIPFWSTACFLYRNASFLGPSSDWTTSDAVEAIISHMGINVSEEDGLFDFHVPEEFDTALKPSNGSDQAYEQADGLVVEDQEYRDLSATDLGLEVDDGNSDALSNVSHFLIDSIHTDDPTILEIVGVLEEYSGAILSGAPGTSKSYYAIKTAEQITSGDWERIANVQFHPSYQYEDFIEGYRPSPNNNGFELKSGIFLEMCQKASESDQPFVFVIDELSRGDAARVFGEALTYVEKSKRGISFTLPSGTSATIPSNVYLIATMNPVDRGADEVDVAFGRRFGTIEMNPSPDILQQRLQENGLDAQLLGPLMNWFSELNTTCIKSNLPGLGQAFFWNVHDSESLRRAWKYQILPHLKKVFQFDVNSFRKFQNDFDNIFKAD